MKNGDMPATPCQSLGQGGLPDQFMFHGLTKREEFAKAFMQSIIAAKHEEIKWWPDEVKQQTFAESAVAYADALLAELAKEQDQ